MKDSLNQELETITRQLIEHCRHRTTDLADDVYAVDVGQYLDEDRFRLEVSRLFRETPLLLALSVEIPEPGDFKTMTAADVPVLVVRRKDGTAASFLNVCRHRGAQVVTEGRGNTKILSCPYHSWSYDLDGTLVHIPASKMFGDVDHSRHALVRLPCVERDGVVWSVLTPGHPLDLDAHLGDLGPELAALELGSMHHGATRRLEAGNWKLAMDSYMENYHLAFLHSTTLYPITGITNITAVKTYGLHQRMAAPRKRITELDEHALGGVDHMMYFSLNYTIFPNTVLLVSPEAAMVAQVLPGDDVDQSITILEHFSRAARTNEQEEKAFNARVDVLSDAVQNEDYWVQGLVQRGLRSGANTHLTFGRNEPLLHHFHSQIDQELERTPSS